jgi:hypothetical protein
MKAQSVVLVCLSVLPIGYLASERIAAIMTEAREVKIAQHASDVAPELAALTGIWEATEDGNFPKRLTVEKIDPNMAILVYAWADHPTGSFKGGWQRVRAKVLPGGKLRWGYPGSFTVQMAKDGMTLEGKREQAGRVATFTMKKVGPFDSK